MKNTVNALTVDLEDWYQITPFEAVIKRSEWRKYESRIVQNATRLLSILKKNDVKATFFVLGWNAERFPDLIKEIDRQGHEIGSHGYAHKLIYEQTPEEFAADLRRSVEILEGITHQIVMGYRAPSFSITKKTLWALDVLLENKIKYDSSIFPIKRPRYGIANGPKHPCIIRENEGEKLVEFPLSVVTILKQNIPINLRIFPYPISKWGLQKNNYLGHPAIVYIHPWEIDPNRPKIKIPNNNRYSIHNINIAGTEKKLRKLLRDFKFAPVKEVLSINEWQKLEHLEIK